MTSCPPEVRWKNGYGYSERLPMGRAFRKYGWDGFEHEIVATGLTESEAKALEIELIADLQTQNRDLGYNICSGGDGTTGWRASEETKRKISEARKGDFGPANHNYGHRWTEEMKKAASERRKNLSDETRKKLSEAAKRRTGEKNPFYGKHHTDETKEILSQLRSRPVKMFDKDMVLLNVFPSIKCASVSTGINKVAISNCCRGVTKTSGGFIWVYADE